MVPKHVRKRNLKGTSRQLAVKIEFGQIQKLTSNRCGAEDNENCSRSKTKESKLEI